MLKWRCAFSLVELSVALVIAGLLAGLALQMSNSRGRSECYTTTKVQLTTINSALQDFAKKNDRYPVPADRRLGVNDPKFGREATASDITGGALDSAGTAPSDVLYGALPFQALGLPTTFAADCWDNKFTYAVTTAYTVAGSPVGHLDLHDPSIHGALTINSTASNVLLPEAAYAVISHGQDGLGAVKRNYTGTNKGWCHPSGTDLRVYDCLANSTTLMAAEFNDGKDGDTNYFDDVIAYYGRPILLSPCNATTVTWGSGHCSASVPNAASGSSVPVVNTLPGYDGTGNAACNNGTFSVLTAICNPALPSSCPASASYIWGPSVGLDPHHENCSAYLPALLDGQSTTLYFCDDQAAAHGPPFPAWSASGQVTVTCNNGVLNQSGMSCINSCFLAQVPVTLADGTSKPVSELKIGDAVKGHTRINHVVTLPTFTNDQRIYGFNGGEKFVTGGHPFFTGHGWKAVDPSLTAGEGHGVKTTPLQVGDVLLGSDDKPYPITSIDGESSGTHALYNPVMDGDHTYYANGLLVHNKWAGMFCDDATPCTDSCGNSHPSSGLPTPQTWCDNNTTGGRALYTCSVGHVQYYGTGAGCDAATPQVACSASDCIGSVVWGGGNCSANIGTLTNGSSNTFSSTASGYTGTATISCASGVPSVGASTCSGTFTGTAHASGWCSTGGCQTNYKVTIRNSFYTQSGNSTLVQNNMDVENVGTALYAHCPLGSGWNYTPYTVTIGQATGTCITDGEPGIVSGSFGPFSHPNRFTEWTVHVTNIPK